MKANDIPHGIGRGGEAFDELADFLDTAEGADWLASLDAGWDEVMALAERLGFIVTAYGGTATIATYGEVADQLGLEACAKRLRTCNIDVPFGEPTTEDRPHKAPVLDAPGVHCSKSIVHEGDERTGAMARTFDDWLNEKLANDEEFAREYYALEGEYERIAREITSKGGAKDEPGRELDEFFATVESAEPSAEVPSTPEGDKRLLAEIRDERFARRSHE